MNATCVLAPLLVMMFGANVVVYDKQSMCTQIVCKDKIGKVTRHQFQTGFVDPFFGSVCLLFNGTNHYNGLEHDKEVTKEHVIARSLKSSGDQDMGHLTEVGHEESCQFTVDLCDSDSGDEDEPLPMKKEKDERKNKKQHKDGQSASREKRKG